MTGGEHIHVGRYNELFHMHLAVSLRMCSVPRNAHLSSNRIGYKLSMFCPLALQNPATDSYHMAQQLASNRFPHLSGSCFSSCFLLYVTEKRKGV
mgnify:CR=1 FL=1